LLLRQGTILRHTAREMLHLPDLIKDLGFILVTAAAVTLLFRQLNQPVVLGYLVAGFLVGPHVPFIPTVTDTQSIKVWAEIGVIFLLFSLGLEFSFKKLAQVGRSAGITASFEVVFMMALGYLVGQLFGWPKMDSIFLGGILAISSTTIIVRAIDELGFKARRFVSLVFGVLIVEDIFAILLLVLLSTVAATKSLAGGELIFSTFKLIFFLTLWFILGIYLIPLFLQKVRRLLTNETTLIVALGLCLFMVLLAVQAGFSAALGAFVMGSILAETREGKTIEHLIVPVKDLFAAIFFVSVGMLIDPKIMLEHWGAIVVITAVTILGKFFSTAVGALVSGQSLRHSVQSGLSLAQIGEFSFIIATLGMSLNVTSAYLYPIAVTVSAITTFTTPYQIRYSDAVYGWIESHMPKSTLKRLEAYQATLRTPTVGGRLTQIWRLYGAKILLNMVVVIAITLAMRNFIYPIFAEWAGPKTWTKLAAFILNLLICSPFFAPIVAGFPPERSLRIFVFIIRFFITIFLLGFILGQFFSLAAASGITVLALGGVLILFSRWAEPVYKFFENKFIFNLSDNNSESLTEVEFLPWSATYVEVTISPDSSLIGKSLQSSQLKSDFGVTIAIIKRGQKMLVSPGGQELLMPYDKLSLVGEERQVEAAQKVLENAGGEISSGPELNYGLESFIVGKNSRLAGQTVRDCGIREKISGLIIGIERGGEKILNPTADHILLAGDLVWLFGERQKIKSSQPDFSAGV